jgi:hypothetical protein
VADRLTQSAPKEIWLQVDPDSIGEDPEPLDEWSECTWCAESVGGAEVKYVRADIADEEIERLRDRLGRLAEPSASYAR